MLNPASSEQGRSEHKSSLFSTTKTNTVIVEHVQDSHVCQLHLSLPTSSRFRMSYIDAVSFLVNVSAMKIVVNVHLAVKLADHGRM